MTKEEYIKGLKAYINEQMTIIQNGGVRHPLSFWVKFNKDKEVEYKAILESQGIVVT
jgi:hypothetical protein